MSTPFGGIQNMAKHHAALPTDPVRYRACANKIQNYYPIDKSRGLK